MHLQTMPLKTAVLPEHCITPLACVWLGTHVLVHMSFKGTFVQEVCKTLFTLEAFFPRMGHHVPPEGAGLSKVLIAHLTHQWLYRAMGQLVFLEVPWTSVLSKTFITLERCFPGVAVLVPLEVILAAE